MELLTEDADLRCAHDMGKVAIIAGQQWVRVNSRRLLVERDPQAAAGLRRNLAALGAEGGRVEAVDALAYLRRPPAAAFEVAFLDPPYEANLLPACCQALVDGGWLVAGAQVYIESRAGAGLPQLPATWELRREGRAGRCRYRLLRAGGATATEE